MCGRIHIQSVSYNCVANVFADNVCDYLSCPKDNLLTFARIRVREKLWSRRAWNSYTQSTISHLSESIHHLIVRVQTSRMLTSNTVATVSTHSRSECTLFHTTCTPRSIRRTPIANLCNVAFGARMWSIRTERVDRSYFHSCCVCVSVCVCLILQLAYQPVDTLFKHNHSALKAYV